MRDGRIEASMQDLDRTVVASRWAGAGSNRSDIPERCCKVPSEVTMGNRAVEDTEAFDVDMGSRDPCAEGGQMGEERRTDHLGPHSRCWYQGARHQAQDRRLVRRWYLDVSQKRRGRWWGYRGYLCLNGQRVGYGGK